MNLVPLYHVVAAVVSVGVSYGVNVALRPEFDTHYTAAEYSEETGVLALSHRGGSLDVPLMTTHITTRDVVGKGIARQYKIRELTLRAAALGGGAPRLELFADLSAVGGDLAGGNHDPSVLLQVELPFARSGRLGARRSFLVTEGARQNGIIAGSLLLTNVMQVEAGPQPKYRAEGRLELQVETERGVDMVTGRWSGKLEWDLDGAPLAK
jgi:hypothetical protein